MMVTFMSQCGKNALPKTRPGFSFVIPAKPVPDLIRESGNQKNGHHTSSSRTPIREPEEMPKYLVIPDSDPGTRKIEPIPYNNNNREVDM